MYRMGVFWGVAKISNIFLGASNSLFFFFGGGGGRTVDAKPEPTYEEKIRVPPPPWDPHTFIHMNHHSRNPGAAPEYHAEIFVLACRIVEHRKLRRACTNAPTHQSLPGIDEDSD